MSELPRKLTQISPMCPSVRTEVGFGSSRSEPARKRAKFCERTLEDGRSLSATTQNFAKTRAFSLRFVRLRPRCRTQMHRLRFRALPNASRAMTKRLPRRRKKTGTSAPNQFSDLHVIESLLAKFGGEPHDNAIDAAQDIMYDAWDASDRKRRIALAKKALELSPLRADAYVLLAQETARDLDEAIDIYRRGVEAGEKAIGKAAIARGLAAHFHRRLPITHMSRPCCLATRKCRASFLTISAWEIRTRLSHTFTAPPQRGPRRRAHWLGSGPASRDGMVVCEGRSIRLTCTKSSVRRPASRDSPSRPVAESAP